MPLGDRLAFVFASRSRPFLAPVLSSPRPQLELQRFERVDASASVALLRVSGTWHADPELRLVRPTLLIDDGRYTHRVSQLLGPDEQTPDATPEGSPWRGAFSVAIALLEHPYVSFALDSGRGMKILPPPMRLPKPASGEPEPAAEPSLEDGARRLQESALELAAQVALLGERASDTRDELRVVCEQAAQRERDHAERQIAAALAARAQMQAAIEARDRALAAERAW
ncbi:MAG: hypothetical protein QOI73_2305, partial [Solirubrobacteraceae bacterium]|nr:hypothetical protein [Solirubrobacteraceae bacterium]